MLKVYDALQLLQELGVSLIQALYDFKEYQDEVKPSVG